jgi:DNA-binding transcriptional ArsR family regulator
MKESEAITALSALAQEHRLRIFRLLVRWAPKQLAAGEIAEAVGIAPTSASFHLKELEQAGLIVSRRQGRFIRYAVEIARMQSLLGFLADDCCNGHPEICRVLGSKPKSSCSSVEGE